MEDDNKKLNLDNLIGKDVKELNKYIKTLNIDNLFDKTNEELKVLASEQSLIPIDVDRDPLIIAIENIISSAGYLKSCGFTKEFNSIIKIIENMINECSE